MLFGPKLSILAKKFYLLREPLTYLENHDIPRVDMQY